MRAWAMAQTVCMLLDDATQSALAAIAGDRSRPLKHILRTRIVLLSAERLPVQELARQASISRSAVWRWQQRFAEEGVEGLLRDKTRPPGTPPHSTRTVAKVLALTCWEPPDEVTHWTGRVIAARVEISLRSVQRIWQEHRLQPHRIRTFKRSHDPAFAQKVEMAQRRRRLLLCPDPSAPALGHVHRRRRSSGSHQSLHRRAQPKPKTLRVDQTRPCDLRRPQLSP